MPAPPYEELFKRLRDVAAIQALVGTSEDLHLDCKVWPERDDEAQRMLAKAVSGFANGNGAVIVIGLEARPGHSREDPDVVQRAAPVVDAIGVKSRIDNLIGQLVEPLQQSVRSLAVLERPESRSGFVVVQVPPTDGFPCRSRKDWKFYLRVSAGTFPMEYFQIADMFGRRRRPVLRLCVEEIGMIQLVTPGGPIQRHFMVGIENCGRAIAKFPSLRFRPVQTLEINQHGIDGRGRSGLPQLFSDREWTVFGGGADHVIYPGTTLRVAALLQSGRRGRGTQFEPFTFTAELSADEIDSKTETRDVAGAYEPPPADERS